MRQGCCVRARMGRCGVTAASPGWWPGIAGHHQSLDLSRRASSTQVTCPCCSQLPSLWTFAVAAPGPSHRGDTNLPCGALAAFRGRGAELVVLTMVFVGFFSLHIRGQVPCPSVPTRILWSAWHLGSRADGSFWSRSWSQLFIHPPAPSPTSVGLPTAPGTPP